MMNREQAVAYGKRIGCRYYVKNSCGGLLGGYKTLEAAEKARREFEEEEKHNPWTKGTVKIFIEEIQ